MREDPNRAIEAYNRALASDPRSARPLGPQELPLWRIGPGQRDPVFTPSANFDAGLDANFDAGFDAGLEHVAPRAFLMTAIARTGLCDLFVHGTGGGRYERVTERWIEAWLGIELAPMSVATATLRLPLEGLLTSGISARTAADVRRAHFDPDLLGQPTNGLSPSKRELLAAIAEAPRRSLLRRERYRELQRFMDERRTVHADALAALRSESSASREFLRSIEIAHSRTWPWPLHGDERIADLRDAVYDSE
jgi:hypothetical protein